MQVDIEKMVIVTFICLAMLSLAVTFGIGATSVRYIKVTTTVVACEVSYLACNTFLATIHEV